MSWLPKNPSFRASFVLALVAFVFVGGMYVVFVGKKTRYHKQRNLRQLAAIGRQLENTIGNYERVLLSFSEEASNELFQAGRERGLFADFDARRIVDDPQLRQEKCEAAESEVEKEQGELLRAEELARRLEEGESGDELERWSEAGRLDPCPDSKSPSGAQRCVAELRAKLSEAEKHREVKCREPESEGASDDQDWLLSELIDADQPAADLKKAREHLEEKWKNLVPLFDAVSVSKCGRQDLIPEAPRYSLQLADGNAVSLLHGPWLHVLVAGKPLFSSFPSGDGEKEGAGTSEGWPSIRVCARVRLDELLRPIFQQDPFDTVVLARPDGAVVYQTEQPQLSLTRIDQLTDAASSKKSSPRFSELAHATQVLDVELSDGDFKLFVQPRRILSLRTTAGASQGPAGGENGTERARAAAETDGGWVVAGLTTSVRFRYASLAVSSTMMALISFGLLIVVFSYPFLKISLLGARQRLRVLDVLLLGICAFLGISLATMFLLDWLAYGSLKKQADDQLEELARALDSNLGAEVRAAYEQLRALEHRSVEVYEILASKRAGTPPASCNYTTKSCADLLRDPRMPVGKGSSYPFLSEIALIDGNGSQLLKWAVNKAVTPRVSVGGRRYFRSLKHDDGWMPPEEWHSSSREPFYLQSILSLADGTPRAVLAKRTWGAAKPDTEPQVIAMLLPMISVIDPVLPSGFGFAVIDDEGTVLFHSRKLHNLNQSLFVECDESALKAAVFARRSTHLTLRYNGRDRRVFYQPLAAFPWSVVTFYDKDLLRVTNIETLLAAGLFLLIYTTGYVAFALLLLFYKPSYRAPWLWPDPHKAVQYRSLAIFLALVLLAEAAAVALFDGAVLLFLAFLLPASALFATYLALGRPFGQTLSRLVGQRLRRPPRQTLSRAYLWDGVLLTLVLAVLPMAAFFKTGHSVHVETLVKYEQLQLSKGLARRWHHLRQEYTDRLGAAKGGLLPVRARLDREDVYTRFLFDTRLAASSEPEAGGDHGEGGKRWGQGSLSRLLVRVLPDYDPQSGTMRELLHDSPGEPRSAAWHLADGRLVFEHQEPSNSHVLRMQSRLPSFFAAPPELVLIFSLSLFFLLLVLTWVVHFVERRVLLVEFLPPAVLAADGEPSPADVEPDRTPAAEEDPSPAMALVGRAFDYQRFLARECPDTNAFLKKVRRKIEAELRGTQPSREQVLAELAERADKYYLGRWDECTDDEKLVLVQLAEEGLVNSKNRRALRGLLNRGLVFLNPAPGLMNASLRRFVLSDTCREVVQLERDSTASAWDRLRWPLTVILAGGVIFVAVTQQEFFNTTIGLLGGIAAGIPIVLRLLGILNPSLGQKNGNRPPGFDALAD